MGTGGGLVVIDFSEQGNSAHFRRDGWSEQEPDRVWGIGPRSLLRVPIQSSGRPMMLEAELAPRTGSFVTADQLVRVSVNGTALGGVRVNRPAMIRCEIDPTIVDQAGMLDIEFGFPGCFRPDLLGIAGDARPLAASFSFVRVYTTDLFGPGPHFRTSHPAIPVIDLAPMAATPPAGAEVAPATFTFGVDGTAFPFLRGGWGLGEDDLAWIAAASCQIELPAPTSPGPYLLRLDLRLADLPGVTRIRELTILLDRIVIGQISLDESTTWVIPLPRELTEGRTFLPLNFIPGGAAISRRAHPSPETWALGLAVREIGILPLPEYLSPIETMRTDQIGKPPPGPVSGEFLADDTDTMPAAIEAALGMDTVTLARGFESLGADCEFGILQRKLGLDVLNLFRFGYARLADLIRALADDLQAVTNPAEFTITLNDADPPEYLLKLSAYNLIWHTFSHQHEADPDTLWRDHTARLGYLRRKFYEGLRGGRKTYVVKQPRPIPVGQAAALLMELNRHGRATLLCVEPASGGRRPGEVELLMPGLMRGYVERFATNLDRGSADFATWLRVIANAALLRRGPVIRARS